MARSITDAEPNDVARCVSSGRISVGVGCALAAQLIARHQTWRGEHATCMIATVESRRSATLGAPFVIDVECGGLMPLCATRLDSLAFDDRCRKSAEKRIR